MEDEVKGAVLEKQNKQAQGAKDRIMVTHQVPRLVSSVMALL